MCKLTMMQPKPSNSLRAIYLILAILFTALAIYGSLAPFRYRPIEFANAWQAFTRDLQVWSMGGSKVDLGVNLLLFVPISFFWLQVLAGWSKSWMRKTLAIIVVLVCCLVVSLGNEFAQSWFPSRVPSVRDVFAQFIGTITGIVIWLTAGATVSDWLRMYQSDRRPNHQIHWLLQAYTVGLIIYSLMPLDLAINPHDIYQKFKSDRVVFLPFSHDYGGVLNVVYAMTTSVLIFVPIGMLAASVLQPLTQPRRPLHIAMLFGFGIVLGIEFAQLFVMTRFSDTTDLITGLVGVAVGIWIMRRWDCTPRGVAIRDTDSAQRPIVSGRWILMTGLYAVVLVILYWAPFDFTNDKQQIRDNLDEFFRVPLSSALQGSRYGALTSIVRKVLLFIPLGVLFVMVARPLPTRFRRLSLGILTLVGWCLALGIELGQVILPDRAAVFDDVFVCTFGIILGIAATSRIVSHAEPIRDQASTGLRHEPSDIDRT